jgi:CO/xanthine dehydrogenase FAD-binding subunit
MIIEYHRPETLEAALALLDRAMPLSKPMGGGTVLNRPSNDPFAVVDLQRLGLDTAESKGTSIDLGACMTLQSVLDLPQIPTALKEAVDHEANYNLRQVATIAGSLVACNGRSPLATALLSMDASLEMIRYRQDLVLVGLGDLLPMREQLLHKALITRVVLPTNVALAYAQVARTPADLPVVCVAVCKWPSGRTRIALGGWGSAPILAMDGPEPEGGRIAAENAFSQAEDQWASAEYRQSVAGVLTSRCISSCQ